MRSSSVSINLKKDQILIKLNENAEQENIVEALKKKLPELKKLYKEEKTPIKVTGKVLKNKEILHIQPFVHVLQSTSDFEGFLLTAESKIFQDFIWYFDMDTLFPISYNFTNKDHKRLEGTIELLNEIANNNSIEPLYKLAFHQNHTIRWKSLQKLINLDFDKGVEVLEYMEDNDSHVEIRYAAKKTLERIQKKY